MKNRKKMLDIVPSFSLAYSPNAVLEEFTGERFVPNYRDGSVELEHIHRYLAAEPFGKERRVLDIACGEGYGSALLAQRGNQVVGVDIDAQTIERASDRYKGSNLTFRKGDIYCIPAASAEFDVIVSFETLEHVENHDKVIEEFKRVLRPGGMLLISTPDRDFYRTQGETPNQYHKKELNHSEMDLLLRKFFKNVCYSKQEIFLGSLVVPEPHLGSKGANDVRLQRFNAAQNELVERSAFSNMGEYVLAIASDDPIENLTTSIYVGDTGPKPASALMGGLKERDDDIFRLRAELSQHKIDIEEMRLDLRMARDSDDTQRRVVAHQRSLLESSRSQLEASQAQLEAIMNSTSWSLTAPLRAIMNAFRRK